MAKANPELKLPDFIWEDIDPPNYRVANDFYLTEKGKFILREPNFLRTIRPATTSTEAYWNRTKIRRREKRLNKILNRFYQKHIDIEL